VIFDGYSNVLELLGSSNPFWDSRRPTRGAAISRVNKHKPPARTQTYLWIFDVLNTLLYILFTAVYEVHFN